MGLSPVFVLTNALRLRRFEPPDLSPPGNPCAPAAFVWVAPRPHVPLAPSPRPDARRPGRALLGYVRQRRGPEVAEDVVSDTPLRAVEDAGVRPVFDEA